MDDAVGGVALAVKAMRLARRGSGEAFEGTAYVGGGAEVIEAVAKRFGRSPLAVLEEIVKGLLVKKGADWTATILGEYVGLYAPSRGAFCVVAEKATGKLVAHAVVFQSSVHPTAGLLAHVRTADGWGGLGLGTLVTEEVTRAAFEAGAKVVVLETDDRLVRKKEGERAAFGVYGKIGYAVLAEERKGEGEARGWLMAIDAELLARGQEAKRANGGAFPSEHGEEIGRRQEAFGAETRRRFGVEVKEARIEAVNAGDLAGLFLLLNLHPPDDFRLKLAAWGVVSGAELERSFVVSVRPAVLDRDRLEEAGQVLREPTTGIVAVCAARLMAPFSRRIYEMDFYCLPEFLATNEARVRALVEATIERIRRAAERPRPCRLRFSGVDAAKVRLMTELGFGRSGSGRAYPGMGDAALKEVNDYERVLD